MGHNYVVLDNLKSTRIPQVDELSMEPPDIGFHKCNLSLFCFSFSNVL